MIERHLTEETQMPVEDYSVSPELLKQAEEATKPQWNLKIPEAAVKKGAFSRWTEAIVVEDAYRQNVEGKNGEQRVGFALKTKVLPYNESCNIGRKFNPFLSVNFGVITGQGGTLGEGKEETEKNLSFWNLTKIKQIAASAGLDITAGITQETLNALFPDMGDDTEFKPEMNGRSTLVGMTFIAGISDKENRDKTKNNGENYQNLDNISPAEGL
jgi:hypothetical protein